MKPLLNLISMHKTTKLKYPFKEKYPSSDEGEIDEKLAPMISLLWSRGYRTFSSCQGEPNRTIFDGAGGIAYIMAPKRTIKYLLSLLFKNQIDCIVDHFRESKHPFSSTHSIIRFSYLDIKKITDALKSRSKS